MIEKITIKYPDFDDLKDKINEIIDAVNGMLCWHENLPRFWQNLSQKKNTENKEPADPYAEQRKWDGKLCRFWNANKDNSTYGILEKVVVNWAYRFKAKNDPYLWDHCEPVKPDDDIIYKGGDNE